MKVTSFLLDPAGLTDVWMEPKPAPARKQSPSLLERLDRWFWRRQVRDREAYLSGAQDIFELEERIRRLERSVGGRYY